MPDRENLRVREPSEAEFLVIAQFSFENFVSESSRASGDSIESLRQKLGEAPTRRSPHDTWLLIERSGQRIGFVWFETRVDESTAFGWDIYLEPEFRSQGVGRHVLQLCAEMLFLKGIRTVKLCVYEHNQVARSLYQSLGFEVEKFDQERRQYTLRRSAAHARA